MALCYVDDVLVITAEPMKTIEGIIAVFKPKGDKTEKPDIYLVASLSDLDTADGTKCWTMPSEKYFKVDIENVEARLAKSDLRFPSRCYTPMSISYHPSKDITREMNAEGLHSYQELILILRWEIEIGRIDILFEVSLLSSHLALPRIGDLQAVNQIF